MKNNELTLTNNETVRDELIQWQWYQKTLQATLAHRRLAETMQCAERDKGQVLALASTSTMEILTPDVDLNVSSMTTATEAELASTISAVILVLGPAE